MRLTIKKIYLGIAIFITLPLLFSFMEEHKNEFSLQMVCLILP